MVHKGLREAIEIGAGHPVFQPGEGRGTRQVLGRLKRDAFDAQLEHGIVPQTIGLIAIRIPRRDLIDPLREKVTEGMVNVRGRALVADHRGQARCETDLPVNAAE
jgi:hypothetical protein